MNVLSRFKPNRDALFALVVLALTLALAIAPSPFKTPFGGDVVRAQARVLQVDDTAIQTYGIVRAGSQTLQVQILNGPFKGQTVEAINDLIGKMETDKMFVAGDKAFVVLDLNGDLISRATAYDHDRLNTEALLVALFAILLIGFAGWSGARALLSFVFTLLILCKLLLPSILLGLDPVLVALGIVLVIAAVTLCLVAGVNKTALVALIGSFLGMLLTSGLAMLLLPAFHLHGAIQPFTETLLYSGFETLNLTRIFLSAIFIGASGAVIDVAIDVATAMNEVIEKRPDLSRPELIRSGFTVGRNMTSTMVTTLLMAYASGYMALLMVFMAQGIPLVNALNTNYVAAEILKTVVGSFGLVTVAPFTALVGGMIYVRKIRPGTVPVTERRVGEPELAQN